MTAPKPDRSEAGAHALLNGWTAYYYLTSFEHNDGWCLWHEAYGAFRTGNAKLIVRVSHRPEGSKEVVMGEVPESFFWALIQRVTILGLLPGLPGIAHRKRADYEDRRTDPGDDGGPPYPARF